MSLEAVEATADASAQAGPFVAGERGLPIEQRARRRGPGLQTLMAAGLVGAVTLAMLLWWFGRAGAGDAVEETERAAARTRQAASAEMKLPPLEKPYPVAAAAAPAANADATAVAENGEGALPPEEETGWMGLPRLPGTYESSAYESPSRYAPQPVDNEEVASSPPDPRLSSPVLWRAPAADTAAGPIEGVRESGSPSRAVAGAGAGRAQQWAERLAGRSRLLARGTIIDCTLETAIDTELPGLATAIVSRDVWSADGSAVVLARGTRLIGVTKSETRAGQSRVWVLWEEARTPSGLVVPLASPATDALGRTGVTGVVDTHFDERFGAAILLSVIDAAAQALASSSRGGGDTVVVDSQGTSKIATEVLRSTIDIPPTIKVAQGTLVQALVAQDVDFSSVMPSAP